MLDRRCSMWDKNSGAFCFLFFVLVLKILSVPIRPTHFLFVFR